MHICSCGGEQALSFISLRPLGLSCSLSYSLTVGSVTAVHDDSDSLPNVILTLLAPFSLFSILYQNKYSMQNEKGELVDLYVPRKCSWTSRLVQAKDHASVQINVANVDPVTGQALAENTPFVLAGYIRFKSEGDMALTALSKKKDMESMNTEGAAAALE